MLARDLFPTSHVLLVPFCVAIFSVTLAEASVSHVPPPRAELDPGPPPLERAPERARRPVALVSELRLSIPTCQSGPAAEPCRALVPAVGAGLVALYRPYPYFSFGAGFSYSRANATAHGDGLLDGELFSIGAVGRVYVYEEGAFDPYLELELGYGSLTTTFTTEGARYEESAFGPLARVGGGLDFVVLANLELGGAVGFTHLLLERGERCAAEYCARGSAPGGAMVGAFTAGLRATVILGAPL